MTEPGIKPRYYFSLQYEKIVLLLSIRKDSYIVLIHTLLKWNVYIKLKSFSYLLPSMFTLAVVSLDNSGAGNLKKRSEQKRTLAQMLFYSTCGPSCKNHHGQNEEVNCEAAFIYFLAQLQNIHTYVRNLWD